MKKKLKFKLLLFIGMELASMVCWAQHGDDFPGAAVNSTWPEVASNNQDDNVPMASANADEFFGPVFYIVKKDETIESIAHRFNLTTEQFNKWNFLPQGIEPGMKVAIRFDWQKKEDTKTAPEPENAVNGNKYHRVVANETLYHLSVVYRVSVEQLREWNNLPDNKIMVNRNLIVGM